MPRKICFHQICFHPRKDVEKCWRKDEEKDWENKEKGVRQRFFFPSVLKNLSFKQGRKIGILANFISFLVSNSHTRLMLEEESKLRVGKVWITDGDNDGMESWIKMLCFYCKVKPEHRKRVIQQGQCMPKCSDPKDNGISKEKDNSILHQVTKRISPGILLSRNLIWQQLNC